jgi:hypothetical protein
LQKSIPAFDMGGRFVEYKLINCAENVKKLYRQTENIPRQVIKLRQKIKTIYIFWFTWAEYVSVWMYVGVHLDKYVFCLCKLKNRNILNFLWWNVLVGNQGNCRSTEQKIRNVYIFQFTHVEYALVWMYFGEHLDKHIFYLCKLKNRNSFNFTGQKYPKASSKKRHRKLGMFIFFG